MEDERTRVSWGCWLECGISEGAKDPPLTHEAWFTATDLASYHRETLLSARLRCWPVATQKQQAGEFDWKDERAGPNPWAQFYTQKKTDGWVWDEKLLICSSFDLGRFFPCYGEGQELSRKSIWRRPINFKHADSRWLKRLAKRNKYKFKLIAFSTETVSHSIK